MFIVAKPLLSNTNELVLGSSIDGSTGGAALLKAARYTYARQDQVECRFEQRWVLLTSAIKAWYTSEAN